MVKTKIIKSHNVPIKFIVKGINVVASEFLVDSSFEIIEKDKLKYSIEINYKLDSSNGDLEIIFSYVFYQGETALHKFETQNLFRVLKNFIKNLNEDRIKERFLLTMTELSLDHSRGIHSYVLKNTFLEKYYIPIIEQKNLGKIIEINQENEPVSNS